MLLRNVRSFFPQDRNLATWLEKHTDSSSTLGNQKRRLQLYEYFCTFVHGMFVHYTLAPREEGDRRQLFW
jgi:hypothetical protein